MPPLEEARQKFNFQHSLYEDAVVMPWYRNQDQPQVHKRNDSLEEKGVMDILFLKSDPFQGCNTFN